MKTTKSTKSTRKSTCKFVVSYMCDCGKLFKSQAQVDQHRKGGHK